MRIYKDPKAPTRYDIEKTCFECGGKMYYSNDGVYEGEFCYDGDYADIEVVSTVDYFDHVDDPLN